MKSKLGILCLALALASSVHAEETNSEWSWGGNSETQETTGDIYVAEESAFVPLTDNVNNNSTKTEDVIDNILVSNRQGRNIEGFEEIYQDPNVRQALESGDDTQARNIIKDRLCNLGLMQCDDESISPKRPYVAPEDLIYAQPVDIKPIGRPIPSIPVRGPPRAYGPPKPLPPSFIPPRKVGYSGPYRPGYVVPSKYGPPGPPPSGGIYESSGFSSGFSNSYEGGAGSTYLSKPPGPIYEGAEIPYEFDRPLKPGYVKDSKQSIIGASSSLSGELSSVQHIHHHYHHGEDKLKQPTVIVNNPVPIGSESHIHSSSSSNGYQNNGFTPIGTGLGASGGLYSGVKPVYESSGSGYSGSIYKGSQNQPGVYNLGYASGSSYAPSASASNSFASGSNSFASGSNSFGSTVGAYGSSNQFYKKELNTSPVLSNQLGTGSAYANQYSNQYSNQNQFAYKGQESGRAENYDCVCVPYDQCPSQDIIGRKDDLFLPIDPRNLKKDIEALSDDKVVVTDGNGTMTIVRVPKSASAENATEESAEPKKIAKRETNDKASESANKANISPRQSDNYDDDSRGIFGKKFQPTFGVSFGLPHSGYGGYPLNPYGPNPIINPYGSSIGGNGLNLGLVNVDPLISVQVTKNDHGHKVIKPLVNLHVTPNGNLVHKLGSFLSHKKELLFNKPFLGGGGGGGFGHYPAQNIHSHYHYGPYRPPRPHYGAPPPYYGTPHFSRPGPPHFHGYHEGYSQGGFKEAPEYDEDSPFEGGPYINDADDISGPLQNEGFYYGRSVGDNNQNIQNSETGYAQNYNSYNEIQKSQNPDGGQNVKFPNSRRRRDTSESDEKTTINDESISRNKAEKRQAYFGNSIQQCGPRHVCCKRPYRPQIPQIQQVQNRGQCGSRHSQGINGRIKNPVYVDGDSEFGEYPWQVAILKKDPKESVYVCGGTLIDHLHIVTAAHCVKTYTGFDLRVRLGEWDVNHDVEFYPYIERDVVSVHVHPQYYAGTLDNDLAILKLDHPVDWTKYPHISPACLPDKFTDYTGARCWTTGWGKDAFGDFGKYQNILKEVDVPVISHQQCESQLRQTRLGYQYQLNPGFVCAGGEEGKDACKGDGGGPMVCERGGSWQLVGVVSWGIGCGQVNVPGVYVKVSHYLDWIAQITGKY